MTWELASSGLLALHALAAVTGTHGGQGAASASPLWVLVVLVLVAVGGRWCWHAWRHPFGPCWSCRGTGRNRGSSGKRFGVCKRCGGTGRRLRTGAQTFHKGITRARRR